MKVQKKFKNIHGALIQDVQEYTLNILKIHPNTTVHVGTDSQNRGSSTTYSTVIAYRRATKGVHCIYVRTKISKITDMWTRLWNETEMTLDVAMWLREQIPYLPIQIDMDYSDEEIHNSSKLVKAAKGFAEGMGFPTVNIKPNNQIATRAADHHCR